LEGDPTAADWRSSFFYFYPREGRFGAPTVLAVRTDTAKLVRYPGRPDWTEVFDLTRDPYEIKNLAGDAAHAGLHKSLEAEFEKQRAAVGFDVPEEKLITPSREDAPVGKKPKGKKKKAIQS
jgi:hypothetical protein